MASIIVSQVDESTLEELRLRANDHGRSVEEEAGEILRSVVTVGAPEPANVYDRIRRIVEPLGGFELPYIVRMPEREPPTFD